MIKINFASRNYVNERFMVKLLGLQTILHQSGSTGYRSGFTEQVIIIRTKRF